MKQVYIIIILIVIVSSAPTEDAKRRVHHKKGDLPLLNRNLFQGDILGYKKPSPFQHLTATLNRFRWHAAVIPYVIDSSLNDHKELIISAMKQFEDSTCVRFVARTNQMNYIYIFHGDGCYSYVGMIDGEQELSLGRGCEYIGTVVHELNHAVGFFHEQTRPDRDDYITIHFENIEPGLESNFEKLDPSETQLYNDFDYDSIMLYGEYSFSKDDESRTITAKEDDVIIRDVYEKPGLDESDIFRINQLYECHKKS